MYRAFYSLSHHPFGKDIRPEDHFDSACFTEATARLKYLVGTRGIGVLTGEAGSGKTFVLRSLAASLSSSLYRLVYLPLSTGTTMDMYRALVQGLGDEPHHKKIDLFGQVQQAILHFSQEKRITPVLMLDEMHAAKIDFLMDLSMIFNFSMDSKNPFVLVLAGLPYLAVRLRLNHAQPLAQRVVMQYKMQPMKKEEVAQYVSHHMKLAGAVTPVFSEPAVEAITSHSGGRPRLVNNLACTSLLLGAQMRQNPIDAEVVRMAADEVSL
jgi:type II secretory pathway predicted ATPase ExeA